MSRFFGYFFIFLFGFVVCAGTIYFLYGPPDQFGGPQRAIDAPRINVGIAKPGANEIAEAADSVSAYVVNIDTLGRPMNVGGYSAFPEYFGLPHESREYIPRGQGSGVIFSPDGYIVTNNHVVENAEKLIVTVFTKDKSGKRTEKQYEASLIGRDPHTDLAVIKIGAHKLDYARFSDSDTLRVGDWVMAVGNPLGLGPTLTLGVVSAKRGYFSIGDKVFDAVIQTDAAINRGNSGGALADINGNLVGINTAIASDSPDGGSIGIGFAIPSNTAANIAEQIKQKGKVIRPYLGIRYMGYNAEVKKMLEERGIKGLPDTEGVMIAEVFAHSPAQKAGIEPNDIVLKINGKQLTSSVKPEENKVTLSSELSKAQIGETIVLDVWHPDGSTSQIGVRVGEMPAGF